MPTRRRKRGATTTRAITATIKARPAQPLRHLAAELTKLAEVKEPLERSVQPTVSGESKWSLAAWIDQSTGVPQILAKALLPASRTSQFA